MVGKAGKVGLSANSWFGWNEETTYGTAVAVDGNTEFTQFLSESLQQRIDIRDVQNISDSHKDSAQTYTARSVVEGDVQMAVVYEGLENLYLHMFGEINNAASGTSGTFTRDFDLADAGRFQNSTSPSLSLHVSRGIVGSGATNPSVFTYEGCVVDGFTFRMQEGGHLELTISFFGQQETLATSSQATSFPTAPVANTQECVVTWGGTEIPVNDMTIECRRNIDRDRFFFGSQYTEEPPMGKYETSFTGTTEWDNEVRASSSTIRADYAALTTRQLLLTFTSTDTMPSVSQNWTLVLDFPVFEIREFNPNVGGIGRVEVPLVGVGLDTTTSSAPHELRLSQTTDDNFTD